MESVSESDPISTMSAALRGELPPESGGAVGDGVWEEFPAVLDPYSAPPKRVRRPNPKSRAPREAPRKRSDSWQKNMDPEAVRYFTPPWLLEEVYGFFAGGVDREPSANEAERAGVDCDPCYDPESFVSATTRYDIRTGQDGLKLPWMGATFVNPPYDAPTPWLKRAAEYAELSYSRVPWVVHTLMLVNAAPGTRAWREHVFGCPHALVCFLAKRVTFYKRGVGYEGPNNRDSAIIYYGPNRARFYERFSKLGTIVAPWKPPIMTLSVPVEVSVNGGAPQMRRVDFGLGVSPADMTDADLDDVFAHVERTERMGW